MRNGDVKEGEAYLMRCGSDFHDVLILHWLDFDDRLSRGWLLWDATDAKTRFAPNARRICTYEEKGM